MKKNKQIPKVDHTKLNWGKPTDADNFQFGRKVSEGVFQFKEFDRKAFPEKFDELLKLDYRNANMLFSRELKESMFWIEDTIVLSNFNQEEIKGHISGYYDTIEEVHEIYGDSAEFIIAECIFEQTSGLY